MNFPPEALERIRKNREEARITADPSTAESGSLVREAVVAGNALCHLAVSIPAAAAPARGTREQAQGNHREGIHQQCLKEVINEELLGYLKQAAESGVAARHGGPLSKVVSKLQNSEVAVKLPMRDGNPVQTEPDEEIVSPASDAMYDLFMQMWAVVGKWLVANRLAAVLQFRSRYVLRRSLHQWTHFSMPELARSSESEHGWRQHSSDGSSDDGSSDDAP